MKKNNKVLLWILSIASGILFSLSWPVGGLSILIFFAFIPLLYIENTIRKEKERFSKFAVFFYAYPAFLIWNIATTYWVWFSTSAAIAAWTLNALFMSLVFALFSYTKNKFYKPENSYFLLPVFWIAFEYLHLNWKITWPWLTLGNVFASDTSWVQWYEYTGFLGGSVWIFIVNILLFKVLNLLIAGLSSRKKITLYTALVVGSFFVPLFFSYHLYNKRIEPVSNLQVIVTQPNLDPYSTQYSMHPQDVIRKIEKLAGQKMNDSLCLVMAPESAIQERIQEQDLQRSESLSTLQKFIDIHPSASILIGASTYKQYDKDLDEIPSTARHQLTYDIYYDVFNTAFMITDRQLSYHHKSKLTPGVEYMPTSGVFKILNSFAVDLGGTVGSLGIDVDTHPLFMQNGTPIAPVICYESIFGDYVSRFVRQGAQMICVITNDGWWGDSPGYKQHFEYAKLRAIENRKWVARSANTGISGFINDRGEVLQRTPYWEEDVRSIRVELNDVITFYAKWGDYLGRIASFFSVLLLLINIASLLKRKTF